MPLRARQALEGLPARIDTRLVFPASQGGVYPLNNFRRREFSWAVAAAGLPETTTPYTLRHSGLSWALAAGIPAVDVARYGGTSMAMLERTYHHLLVSSAESARARMDAFMVNTARQQKAFRRGVGVAVRRPPAPRNNENPVPAGFSLYAPGKIRTCGLCLRRAALYPLSYGRGDGKSSCVTTRSPTRSCASRGTSTRT